MELAAKVCRYPRVYRMVSVVLVKKGQEQWPEKDPFVQHLRDQCHCVRQLWRLNLNTNGHRRRVHLLRNPGWELDWCCSGPLLWRFHRNPVLLLLFLSIVLVLVLLFGHRTALPLAKLTIADTPGIGLHRPLASLSDFFEVYKVQLVDPALDLILI